MSFSSGSDGLDRLHADLRLGSRFAARSSCRLNLAFIESLLIREQRIRLGLHLHQNAMWLWPQLSRWTAMMMSDGGDIRLSV